MAFTAKILSWRFRHLNIVSCLLKRRPTKGGSRAPQDPPLATPLDTQSSLSWFSRVPTVTEKTTSEYRKNVEVDFIDYWCAAFLE